MLWSRQPHVLDTPPLCVRHRRHYVRRTSLELLRWWAAWAVTQARHNRAIAIVTEARVQRVLRASWKAWAVTYLTQRRQHRATMVMVEEWRLRSNVVRCIRRWHKHAAAQAVSRQQRTHAIAMWRSGLLGRVWNAWKAHAGARARVRRSVHTLEYWVWRSRFRVAWRVWRDGVALFNFDRDAARRTRVWRMRRTLRLWNRRAKVQALAARVTTRRQGVALCEALWTWRRFLCGQRVQRRRAQREAAVLSRAVAVWRAKVAWILHERRMIPRAERLWRRNQQVCCCCYCCADADVLMLWCYDLLHLVLWCGVRHLPRSHMCCLCVTCM